MKVEPLPVDHRIPYSARLSANRRPAHLLDCCAHQAHNRAIMDIHCLNRLTDRSARSLLEKSCATLALKMVNFQLIVPAPAQVRTSHSLSCNLHWECKITATKLDAIRSGSPIDRKNVRQHLSFGFGIRRYVPRYRDGGHKSQGILVRARCDFADVPDRSHRSCATRRGTPGRSVPEALATGARR